LIGPHAFTRKSTLSNSRTQTQARSLPNRPRLERPPNTIKPKRRLLARRERQRIADHRRILGLPIDRADIEILDVEVRRCGLRVLGLARCGPVALETDEWVGGRTCADVEVEDDSLGSVRSCDVVPARGAKIVVVQRWVA
jgi:hypothetical protein